MKSTKKRKAKKVVLPSRLCRGQNQFERWRANRQERRIPERLWNVASELGAEFGVHQTCRALRLNYDELKKRVSSAEADNAKRRVFQPEAKTSGFVPLSTGIGSGAGCAEYKRPDGSWMRIEWRGAAPELGSLSESFFFGGRSCSK
jgi:hypothetical protein